MLTETWSPSRTASGIGSVHSLAPGRNVIARAPWNVARWPEPVTSAGFSGDRCRPAQTERTTTGVSANGLLSRIRKPAPAAVTVRTLRTVASGDVPCTPSSADSVRGTVCGPHGAASATPGTSDIAQATAKATPTRPIFMLPSLGLLLECSAPCRQSALSIQPQLRRQDWTVEPADFIVVA